MRWAAQYLRMSSDKQKYSLAAQAAAIAHYAERHGFSVIESYEDAGKSGLTCEGRAGLQRLLRDVLSPHRQYSTVLVLDVSRWGRFQDPDEAAHYEFMCRQAGVQVNYCEEPFENDRSATSSIVKNLKRVMAADYSRQLSDRCKTGLRRSAQRGAKLGGLAPYGSRRQAFDLDGTPGPFLSAGERCGRLDQSVRLSQGPEDERENVREVFRLFTKCGLGMTEISAAMNARSRLWRDGKPWLFERVRGVLTNEIAIGVAVFNQSSSQLGGRPIMHSASEWHRVVVAPPIVTRATFNRAQAKIKELRGRSHTDREVLESLKRLLKRQGYLSRSLIDRSSDTPRCKVYEARFGSMKHAYDLVGYRPATRHRHLRPPSEYSNQMLLDRLHALLTREGYLTASLITRCADVSSVTCLVSRFGSLREAYKRVGWERTRGELQAEGWGRRRMRQVHSPP